MTIASKALAGDFSTDVCHIVQVADANLPIIGLLTRQLALEALTGNNALHRVF
ncbi:hypothetical protein U5801_01025 [Lamprobacter modestohalophilus]|nr:hypothetical protein [Lamprobacter modestohalophilus]MEA1048406.1 hypothetical protein [Lamprobacter modestohalophilus]